MTHYLSGNTDCPNTTNSFNKISGSVNVSDHFTVADHQHEILRWLSPLEPRVRHQDIRTLRADNVGHWLLGTDEFRSWSGASGEANPKNAALFCYGDPGVGKTYLSSLVIDRLGDQVKGQPDAIAFFYFDFAARNEQTPINMLGSLLKQIVSGLDRIPEDIVQAFEEQKKITGGRRLRVPEIVKMLRKMTCSQRTFICIDALDECAEMHRAEVFESLREILEKSKGARIFMTGIWYNNGLMEKNLGWKTAEVHFTPKDKDIRGYIRMRLSKDTSLGTRDSSLQAEIMESLAEEIGDFGTSLLPVSIALDTILRETTVSGRRKKLLALPDRSSMEDGYGLTQKRIEDAYGTTLESIVEQGGERARLGIAALMWISHSERPLQPDELLQALTVEIESAEPNPENTPSIQTLLSCCLGLVTFDRGASRVRLIHFTLQEYLYTRSDLYANAHSKMAETCLTYLNFQSVKDLSPALNAAPQSAPFLQYCSLYWGVHAKKETSSSVISLALDLFSQFENHLSTKLLLADMLPSLGRCLGDIPTNGHLVGFTGLHCASLFGILEIATALTNAKSGDLNKRDFLSLTPLMWAAIFGQEQVVKLLLTQRDVNPNKVDKFYGRSAVSWAARKGHQGVWRLFLGRTSRNPDGTNDLCCETQQVANLFFGRRYVNCEKPDKSGRTPLSWAASSGSEGVVGLLLGRDDVNPDRADPWGLTPLSWAANGGHEGVVKLLLGRDDVSPNSADSRGRTPLWKASYNGHEEVVKLLLGRGDVNPNSMDREGKTPFSMAAGNGQEGVAKLLLGRDDVNPDIPDKDCHTPLSRAAAKGHERTVKLLLGRGDVNLNSEDKYGRTPLFRATENRREGVVKLLLEKKEVNPNRSAYWGRTPLLFATECGHEGTVKLLLRRGDVDPNIADKEDQTPLSHAIAMRRDGMVKLLLERGDVNPNRLDMRGWRPLSIAASDGHEGVVKLLLGRDDVNPDIPDNDDRTPLSWAAIKSRERVVKLLLGRDDINPNIPDKYGQTPLSWAAVKGHEGVVKLLLGRKDVSPDIPDKVGRTPLSWAAIFGHGGVVKLLLVLDSVNPDIRDEDGRTPLSWAAAKGHERVVKQLLGLDNVNPNIPDEYGQTPLCRATNNGHEAVATLLLERKDINPRARQGAASATLVRVGNGL